MNLSCRPIVKNPLCHPIVKNPSCHPIVKNPSPTHICMHKYIQSHAYIQIYIHTYSYIHIYSHTCMHTCIHSYINLYTYMCAWTPPMNACMPDILIHDFWLRLGREKTVVFFTVCMRHHHHTGPSREHESMNFIFLFGWSCHYPCSQFHQEPILVNKTMMKFMGY